MNVLKEVSGAQSVAMRDKVVRYVGKRPNRFAELIVVFLGGPYRVTQHASWPLTYCVEAHPELVKPHLRKLIHNLSKPGIHDAVKRNTVRLLQFVEIPPTLQGSAANICFKLLGSTREPIAVRVFSMSVLGNIARKQPELRKELKLLIENQLPYASAGFRNRALKVLKALDM